MTNSEDQDEMQHKAEIVSGSPLFANYTFIVTQYSKTCLKRPPRKNTKIVFQYRLSLNAGQKYCRMLQLEHSAILSTFINLPFSIKTFVLSIFK